MVKALSEIRVHYQRADNGTAVTLDCPTYNLLSPAKLRHKNATAWIRGSRWYSDG